MNFYEGETPATDVVKAHLCGESNHKLGHNQADAQGRLRVLLIVIIKQGHCDALFYPLSI